MLNLDLKTTLDFIVSVSAVSGLVLTALNIRSQSRNSRIEKIADVLMACSDRFHAIDALKDELERSVRTNEMSKPDARARYYFEYWHFQWDQWNYFRLGLIPPKIYAEWFYQRLVIIRLKKMYFGVTFLDGWNDHAQHHFVTYADFHLFVNQALACAEEEDAKSRRTLAKLINSAYERGALLRADFVKGSAGGWA